MNSMAVLYLRRLGQPVAALFTTVPGDPPVFGQATTLRMAVPIPDPPFSGPSIPRPITVERDDLAIAQLDAEFDDPLEVFQWRVVTTQGPDGTQRHSLDRLGARDATVGTTTGLDLLLDATRLGIEQELSYEVRNEAGMSLPGTLVFGPNDTRKTAPVNVPNTGVWVVFIEGYPPTVPVQLTVTRGGTGQTAGRQLVLDVPRLGDRTRLNYEVRNAGNTFPGSVIFAPADTKRTATITVTDKTACDVIVDGYPPTTVPAAP